MKLLSRPGFARDVAQRKAKAPDHAPIKHASFLHRRCPRHLPVALPCQGPVKCAKNAATSIKDDWESFPLVTASLDIKGMCRLSLVKPSSLKSLSDSSRFSTIGSSAVLMSWSHRRPLRTTFNGKRHACRNDAHGHSLD